MLAPLAPHVAEELWSRLGHAASLAWQDFPVADPALLTADDGRDRVQVNGKVRATLDVPADADDAAARSLALADERVGPRGRRRPGPPGRRRPRPPRQRRHRLTVRACGRAWGIR